MRTAPGFGRGFFVSRMSRMSRFYAILTGVLTTERTTMETPQAPGLNGVMLSAQHTTVYPAMGEYAAARWWAMRANHTHGGEARRYAATALLDACDDLQWAMQHRAQFIRHYGSTL